MTLIPILYGGAALTAFGASVFWFLSALVGTPGVPFGGDGWIYSRSLQRVTLYNRIAALLSGLSAVFVGAALSLAI